jgi:sortase B
MKKKLWLAAGILLALAAAFFGVRAVWSLGRAKPPAPPPRVETSASAATPSEAMPPKSDEEAAAPTVETPPEETKAEEIPPTQEEAEEEVAVEEPEPYVSPIDFASLQAANPDIYAWLEIKGTDITYPLLQSAEDDAFYLNHDSERIRSADGSLFSESRYNGRTMEDPVTLIYGHHMRSGAMFGNLERDYTDQAFLEAHREITVYTPEAELRYGVFAAVPWSGEHLLYYYDFRDEAEYSRFFASVFRVRDLRARFYEENAPAPEDRVLILSTCLAADNTHRFLVMAKLMP